MIRANRQKGKPATERLWPRPSLGAPPGFPRLGFARRRRPAAEQTRGDRPRLAIPQAAGRPSFCLLGAPPIKPVAGLGAHSSSAWRAPPPRAARPAPSGPGQKKKQKNKKIKQKKNKKQKRPATQARKPGDFESGFRPSGLARARRERAKAADQRSLNSRRCWLVAHHAPHMPKNATAAAIAAISRPVKKRHVKPKP